MSVQSDSPPDVQRGPAVSQRVRAVPLLFGAPAEPVPARTSAREQARCRRRVLAGQWADEGLSADAWAAPQWALSVYVVAACAEDSLALTSSVRPRLQSLGREFGVEVRHSYLS